MKRIITILTALLITVIIFLSLQASAQAPQKMSYQAVIRNATDVLVTNTSVGMRISIIQGSIFGASVYIETQTISTNANGLVSIEIGTGTIVTGNFSTIDWANGPYFIKTETDLAGGTTYTITGTNELLSVPYALFSANGTPGPTGPQGPIGLTGDTGATGGYPVHFIGESYGGGIVFYVYDGGQHGLIAATSDQSSGIRWYGGSHTDTRARADGIGAGLKNTSIIIADQGPVDGNDFAATVCNEYSVTIAGVTYGDWYLPSKHELNLLYLQKNVVGGFGNTNYWSSSEYSFDYAWYQTFDVGNQYNYNKNSTYYVRAIRAF